MHTSLTLPPPSSELSGSERKSAHGRVDQRGYTAYAPHFLPIYILYITHKYNPPHSFSSSHGPKPRGALTSLGVAAAWLQLCQALSLFFSSSPAAPGAPARAAPGAAPGPGASGRGEPRPGDPAWPEPCPAPLPSHGVPGPGGFSLRDFPATAAGRGGRGAGSQWGRGVSSKK